MFRKIILTVAAFAVICSCKNNNGGDVTKFDSQSQRTAYLENLAQNYITPELTKLKETTANLKIATDTFALNVNSTNLEKLQEAYETAYLQYLKLDAFRFGAFKDFNSGNALYNNIALFPCNKGLLDTVKIKKMIFNPNDANTTTRGFDVIDYLIFKRTNNNDSVLLDFAGENKKFYLKKNSTFIDSMVNQVKNDWTMLSSTFSKSAGTDAGSNLTFFFNSYLESYETAKNFKVQIPGGYNANNLGIIKPEMIEGLSSGKSKKFLKAHVENLYAIWMGNFGVGSANVGFDDVVVAQTHDSAFVKTVVSSFNDVLTAIDALPEQRLDATIKNPADNAKLKDLYDKMARLTMSIKSEMVSKFGFSVSYSSNDGD